MTWVHDGGSYEASIYLERAAADDTKARGTFWTPIVAYVQKHRELGVEKLLEIMRSMGLDPGLVDVTAESDRRKPDIARHSRCVDAEIALLLSNSGPRELTAEDVLEACFRGFFKCIDDHNAGLLDVEGLAFCAEAIGLKLSKNEIRRVLVDYDHVRLKAPSTPSLSRVTYMYNECACAVDASLVGRQSKP